MANKFQVQPTVTNRNSILTDFEAPQIAQKSKKSGASTISVLLKGIENQTGLTPRIRESFEQQSLKPLVKRVTEDIPKELDEFNKRDVKDRSFSLALSFNASGSNVAKNITNTIKEGADEVVTKLVRAIREAKPVREKLSAQQSLERGKRAGRVGAVLETAQGEKTHFQALGKLKGQLVESKPKFESLRSSSVDDIETKLTQVDIDNLFAHIQRSELDIYDKISTGDGLGRLLNGEVPQPNQISKLEDLFGKDLIEAILDKRSRGEKIKDLFVSAVNLPRTLLASMDMSAPFRQGIILTTSKPKIALRAFGTMFKNAFSEKNYIDWLRKIKQSPEFRLMEKSGLYIADPTKISGGLSAKEEAFMTNLADKIPLVKHLVRFSERAYTSYLNKLRVDTFRSISEKFIKEGISDESTFKSLADFVNSATGRGDLGKTLNRTAPLLNNLFFSPRLIASRFQMMNPVWYAKQDPRVRKEAMKSMAEFIGVGLTVLGLAASAGADVELDPRSTDFGKIRIGDTRWDIWGGFQQWARFFTQLATGERKTQKGEIVEFDADKFPYETRLDLIERFFRGKTSPSVGLALELLEGQKLYGGDIELDREAIEKTVPLYIQGIQEAHDEMGPSALFTVGIPAFFGIGTQTYKPSSYDTKIQKFNRDTGGGKVLKSLP